MNKTSNSQGYITYRNDRKKWESRIYELDPVTNTKKCKSKLFKTKEEA